MKPVCVVTMWDDAYSEIAAITLPNMREYCDKNGYDFIAEKLTQYNDRHTSWSKINLVRRLIENYMAILYVDIDTCFLSDRPVKIAPSRAAVFSQDWNGLCAASFLILSCSFSRRLLDCLYFLGDVKYAEKYGSPEPKWEQNAIKALADEFPSVRDSIDFFDKKLLADMNPEWPITEDTWIFHAGGIPVEDRIMVLQDAITPL